MSDFRNRMMEIESVRWLGLDLFESFQKESNHIENIPYVVESEVEALARFVDKTEIVLGDLVEYVGVVQPNARLRDIEGLDVRVGSHIAPSGGPTMPSRVTALLEMSGEMSSFELHAEYETLHPFTDGNGRSGRALWLWHVLKYEEFVIAKLILERGFLHSFYYQALNEYRNQ